MLEIQSTTEGLTFWVWVQPRASRKAITGHYQNALKVKLTAPPVDGAANQQCIEVLAKALHLPKSSLTIVGGHTNRRKQILIRPKIGTLSASERQHLKDKLEYLTREEK